LNLKLAYELIQPTDGERVFSREDDMEFLFFLSPEMNQRQKGELVNENIKIREQIV